MIIDKKTTTITISHELWEYIQTHRTKPSETLEDVIWGFISLNNKKEAKENEY